MNTQKFTGLTEAERTAATEEAHAAANSAETCAALAIARRNRANRSATPEAAEKQMQKAREAAAAARDYAAAAARAALGFAEDSEAQQHAQYAAQMAANAAEALRPFAQPEEPTPAPRGWAEIEGGEEEAPATISAAVLVAQLENAEAAEVAAARLERPSRNNALYNAANFATVIDCPRLAGADDLIVAAYQEAQQAADAAITVEAHARTRPDLHRDAARLAAEHATAAARHAFGIALWSYIGNVRPMIESRAATRAALMATLEIARDANRTQRAADEDQARTHSAAIMRTIAKITTAGAGADAHHVGIARRAALDETIQAQRAAEEAQRHAQRAAVSMTENCPSTAAAHAYSAQRAAHKAARAVQAANDSALVALFNLGYNRQDSAAMVSAATEEARQHANEASRAERLAHHFINYAYN